MQIKREVLIEIEMASVEGRAVRLARQMTRALYLDVDKVLRALGGKWERRAKAHVFERDIAPMIDAVMLTGEVELPEEFDAFYTPPGLANKLINRLVGGEANRAIDSRHRFLEPSAGEGAIVREIVGRGAGCFAFEIRPQALEKLLKECPAACRDFMKIAPPGVPDARYDYVAMNPPFSKQQDIDHVMHAYRFLRPGGRLISVMSAGVLFRQNRKTVEFREWVEKRGGEIEPLPEGSFKPATAVSTVIVTLDARI